MRQYELLFRNADSLEIHTFKISAEDDERARFKAFGFKQNMKEINVIDFREVTYRRVEL